MHMEQFDIKGIRIPESRALFLLYSPKSIPNIKKQKPTNKKLCTSERNRLSAWEYVHITHVRLKIEYTIVTTIAATELRKPIDKPY